MTLAAARSRWRITKVYAGFNVVPDTQTEPVRSSHVYFHFILPIPNSTTTACFSIVFHYSSCCFLEFIPQKELMSCTQTPNSLGLKFNRSQFFPIDCTKPLKGSLLYPSDKSKVMWRNVSRRLSSRTLVHSSLKCRYIHHTCSSLFGFSQDPIFSEKLAFRPVELDDSLSNKVYPGKKFLQMGQILPVNENIGVRNHVGFNGLCVNSYASVAVDVVSPSTDADEEIGGGGDEVETLLTELKKEEHRQAVYRRWLEKRVATCGSISTSTDSEEAVGGGGNGPRKEEQRLDGDWWRQKRARMGGSVYEYKKLRKRQVKIETEAWEQATKEYNELLKDMCEQKLAPNLPYMKSLFLGWFEPFCKKIAEDQELCGEGKRRAAYAPYFELLPADKMAVITMHKLMGLVMTGGEHGCVRVVSASCSIGEAIEQEIRIHKFLEKNKKKKAAKDKEIDGQIPDTVIKEQEGLRKKVTSLMKKQKLRAVGHIMKSQDGSKPWAQHVKAQVGSRLIELLLESAYIQSPGDQVGEMPPDIRPAFVHTIRTSVKEGQKSGRRFGVIECDPLVRKGLERSSRHMVIPYMPMLIPPVKWTGFDRGAHLFLPSYVMRIHGSKQQREAMKKTPAKNLQPVFEALDTLGSTKWRMNKRVLAVVDRIWSSGGRVADLVDRDDIPLPEKPDTEDEEQLKTWKWKLRTVKKENLERHSQRCDVELKLAVARKLKDEAGFFYPHNLDFRGRAYPLHPHLNHLGSDMCRGILEFAEGRPLGKSGLRWLKIHLANLFAGGVDKLSLEGRLAFTENHLDDIFDSADRPLEGGQWWLGAEDPFQCLAVCINLAEALRSPSPETTISHIPVHQDGSCNGLQHYAALGRDKLGASAVNLVEGERPADVYSGIAARVLNICKRDSQEDPAVFPDALHARLLVNQVDRKLVKQTVMTSVYGVTYIGARDQIKRRLKERNNIDDDKQLFGAACYAAKVTLTALGEMFEGARDIMTWLGDCAKIIASENQAVQWTTPLGLPVVQPYRKFGKQIVKTSLQALTLQRETEKVMVKRQRTAFPPNFVHSLDGSHMMMTAVACRRAGLNFAGVHDSYWTHACDIDQMNRILREKFVELYQTPILENLLEGFEQSHPTLSFPPLPERGDFDLKDVLDSPYFFN